MPADHRHSYVYTTLRLLTLNMPDDRWRVYTSRNCRWCGKRDDLTGSGHKSQPPYPALDTFWATPRTPD